MTTVRGFTSVGLFLLIVTAVGGVAASYVTEQMNNHQLSNQNHTSKKPTIFGSTEAKPKSKPSVAAENSTFQCPSGSHNEYDNNTHDMRRCAADAPTSAIAALIAEPTSGALPLTVAFSGTISVATYILDFGDGSPVAGLDCSRGCSHVVGTDPNQLNITHTYSSPGSYQVRLTSAGKVLGTVTISVADR